MPPLILSFIEKKALEHVAITSSAEVKRRVIILLMLGAGEKWAKIAQHVKVTDHSISKWKKRWIASELQPQTWDDAVAKVEEILGGGMGRPKKVKVKTEVSKIVEISEWCKTRQPGANTYQHNKQVAEAAKQKGLPEMSPRTVGRLLEENKVLSK